LISEDIIDANFLKRDLRASEEIKQKFNNSDANESNKAKEAIKFEEEFNVEDMKKTKETYNQVQKYFKTNIRQFFHNISQLFNLKKLDLSNNKIHFFDIDPFFIQKTEGFRALTHLDLSNNLIKEEIGILLVMNLPLIECLKFTGNPLLQDKKSFEKIEYEIFRNKNILLENELNMMKEKRSNYKGHFICAIKPLKVNVSDSDKLLAKKIRPATCEGSLD
jgi:Leucine-rich repeat (LRR) protein